MVKQIYTSNQLKNKNDELHKKNKTLKLRETNILKNLQMN